MGGGIDRGTLEVSDCEVVFLDVACIDQRRLARKAEGIASLGSVSTLFPRACRSGGPKDHINKGILQTMMSGIPLKKDSTNHDFWYPSHIGALESECQILTLLFCYTTLYYTIRESTISYCTILYYTKLTTLRNSP